MTPEEVFQRREWAERDAREDVRKEIEQILADVHHESITGEPATGVPLLRTTARFASLLGNLYLRAERQTAKVVRLTWALLVLTAALLFLTGYLCYDAYLNRQRYKAEQRYQTQPNQPDSEIQLTVPY